MFGKSNSVLWWSLGALMLSWNLYEVQSACPAPPAAGSDVLNATTATSIMYTCPAGNIFTDGQTSISFTCPYNGVDLWGPVATVPSCAPRNCSAISSSAGISANVTGLTYGNTAYLECLVNGTMFYDGTTTKTLTCQQGGQWSAAVPTVCGMMCPQVVGTIAMIPYTPSGSAPTSAPPAIQALIGNSTGRFLGSYVRLDCPVGYQLTYGTQKAGIDIYNCLASGAWNPSDIDQLRCKLTEAPPFTNNVVIIALIGTFGGLVVAVAMTAIICACITCVKKEDMALREQERRQDRRRSYKAEVRKYDAWMNTMAQRAYEPEIVYVQTPDDYPYRNIHSSTYSVGQYDPSGKAIMYEKKPIPAITQYGEY